MTSAIGNGNGTASRAAAGIAIVILSLLLTAALSHISTKNSMHALMRADFVPREAVEATYATKEDLRASLGKIEDRLDQHSEDLAEIKTLLRDGR